MPSAKRSLTVGPNALIHYASISTKESARVQYMTSYNIGTSAPAT